MFEGVEGAGQLGGVTGGGGGAASLRIADAVTVTQVPATAAGAPPHLLVEWEGGAVGDMLADATVALILQVRAAPSPAVQCHVQLQLSCRCLLWG